MLLLDTSVAVSVRDQAASVALQLAERSQGTALSLITLVELEGGIAAKPAYAADRRAALNILLTRTSILPFDHGVVDMYGTIIRAIGFSRPRILDRLIAATAIVHDLTLVTINGPDFRDIPGLKLEIWPSATQ